MKHSAGTGTPTERERVLLWQCSSAVRVSKLWLYHLPNIQHYHKSIVLHYPWRRKCFRCWWWKRTNLQHSAHGSIQCSALLWMFAVTLTHLFHAVSWSTSYIRSGHRCLVVSCAHLADMMGVDLPEYSFFLFLHCFYCLSRFLSLSSLSVFLLRLIHKSEWFFFCTKDMRHKILHRRKYVSVRISSYW